MLAELSNLSIEAIGTLERGIRRAPHAETLNRLKAALNLDKTDGQLLVASVDRRRAPRQSRRLAFSALPAPLTRLIGREGELSAARAIVTDRSARLLTVTGVGGVGKTRFALELGRRIQTDFDDGVGFVGLAAIRDSAHVAAALGACLERKGDDEAPSFDALCAQIGDKRVLVIVDNFEHVLPGGPVVVELLSRCRSAAIVVTSREALRVNGEHEYGLLPLPLSDAVDLMVDRSLAIRPDFNAAGQTETLEAICRQLDGLPLAIELAAARVRHYSLHALHDRLTTRLDVLVSGPRDAPPRQRTMRAAIEWSYQLLNETEAAIFQIASLFAGRCSLEAMESLTASTPEVASYSSPRAIEANASSLVDKHLLLAREDEPGHIAFAMLETIREFAREQLGGSGNLERFQKAFAEYYESFASRAYPHLRGPDASAWFDSIGREFENIRTTMQWAVAHDRALGLRILLNLDYFWSRGVHRPEAHGWFKALVDPSDDEFARRDPRAAWRALNMLALSYSWTDDRSGACELYVRVLELARRTGDQQLIARTLNNFGSALYGSGEFERAKHVLEESLAIKRAHDDAWSIATTLSNLGTSLRGAREFPVALERHREALDLFITADDRWGEIAELNDIADTYRDLGTFPAAARFYRASLDANVDSLRPLVADSFDGLAGVAASRLQFRQSAVLAGAADVIHREIDQPIAATDRAFFDAACDSSRTALGSAGFETAWSEGASLGIAEAIEIARAIATQLSS